MQTDDIVTRLLNACDSNNCWCPMIDKRCIYAEAADEIERLRRCLQHAIDHVGKWGLFTAEEKQAVLTEYEQVVQGD